MFYAIFSVITIVLLITYIILSKAPFKGNEKFNRVITKILKISVVVYCFIVFFSVLLPDAFTLCLKEDVLGNGTNQGFALLRWFNTISFIVLPIAVFYKNRVFKNIALFFCLPVALVSIFFYPQFMECFTSLEGRGLNSMDIVSQGFKNFMINPIFRGIVWGITLGLQILIPTIMAIHEKHFFNFKDKNEYKYFFIILPLIILLGIPIYVPQYLFGYSNILFDMFTWSHILWLCLVVVEGVALFFIFRKKDPVIKNIMLLTLSLALIYQYFQMFGAISIKLDRIPLQLCNIGAFLILLSLITKNTKIFNFTVIINVVGAIIALAMPDLDGKGLFYLYNMHFIFEHTSVLLVPILALSLKVFPRLNKKALKDCLIGFSIYFVCVLALGTAFNAIFAKTGKSFYEVNYMFMFLQEEAADILPFAGALFDYKFSIGYATFYPVIQSLVFVVFMVLCILLYFFIKLIYLINNKIYKKKKDDGINPSEDNKTLLENPETSSSVETNP